MKTFSSGEPLSGWHWVCPCDWSIHDSDVGRGENALELMNELIKKHRSEHVEVLQRWLG